MKKHDGRRKNDNSRIYHTEREEETVKAVRIICEGIKNRGEPRLFSHVAATMKKSYKKPILVGAQTLSTNTKYRNVIDDVFKDNSDMPNPNIRKNNPKSNAELRNEIHKEKIKSKQYQSEIKILKHQIKQSNITVGKQTYDTPDIGMINQLEMSNTSLLQLITELSKLGHFYWDKDEFKKASDGKIYLTQKSMLLMGIEPKLLPNLK